MRMNSESLHTFPTWASALITVAALGLIVWFLIVPQFSDAEAYFEAIRLLSVPLVTSAILLQVASPTSYSILTGLILGWGSCESERLFGSSHRLRNDPDRSCSGAVAGAARFRLFVAEAVSSQRSVSAATMQNSISNVTVTGIFRIGVLPAAAQPTPNRGSYFLP